MSTVLKEELSSCRHYWKINQSPLKRGANSCCDREKLPACWNKVKRKSIKSLKNVSVGIKQMKIEEAMLIPFIPRYRFIDYVLRKHGRLTANLCVHTLAPSQLRIVGENYSHVILKPCVQYVQFDTRRSGFVGR